MRSPSLVLAPVIVLLACPVTLAQTSSARLTPQVSVDRRFAPPEASHRHSSTANEGNLRGRATVITAYGDYLLDESQAAYVWQHVKSMHYDNKLKKRVTGLAHKQILEEYRENKRQQKRAKNEARSREKYERDLELASTYRLSGYEFNWQTGAIYWPALVAGPRYAQHRKELAILISQAVRSGEADSRAYCRKITKACGAFRKQLLKNAAQDHTLTHGEYTAMQRYLQGLKYTPLLMAQASAAAGEYLVAK